ncbi:MAG: T9SS type A sorting domain-containing protein [Ekhidna sp.]|nr:T9SS type A sorting domain-containing protein [Ekhidna sp.]
MRNIAYKTMRSKFIILSFAGLLSLSATAQPSFGQEGKVNIYPNPAVDFLMVQIDGDAADIKFELNSIIGNKVVIKLEEMGDGKYKIPVKNLAIGYYFLIIKDEKKRFKKAFKFLKH